MVKLQISNLLSSVRFRYSAPMPRWCNGSHAGLRSQWRNPCRFESDLRHQQYSHSIMDNARDFYSLNVGSIPAGSARYARVVELVYTTDLKSVAVRITGSSPVSRTRIAPVA